MIAFFRYIICCFSAKAREKEKQNRINELKEERKKLMMITHLTVSGLNRLMQIDAELLSKGVILCQMK